MTKYVALLRGINVGGNRKVEMSKLKKCFESAGYKNVSTYINSGNVIFETANKNTSTIVKNIEKILEKTFGFKIQVIIRDKKNIQKICKLIPSAWTNDTDQRTDVLFLWDEYDSKKSLKLISTTPTIDTLIYVSGAIIWNVEKKHYTKSGMHKFIGSTLYKNMTARNINTLRKISTLL